MKKWRIGTTAMGLSLIFFGVGLFVHQFNPDLAYRLVMSCLPFAFFALGVEMLLAQYLARKTEAGYAYDFLSMVFVFLLGLLGLGLYSLQASGFLGQFAAAAFARPQAVEYRRELVPRGRVKEVILESAADWRYPVRVWDADGERITVIVRGFTREKEADGEFLAPAVVVEEVGEAVYLRLRAPYPDLPWGPRIDQAEIMIPPKYRLNARACFNLNVEEFRGTLE